jgi:hypothetical protein
MHNTPRFTRLASKYFCVCVVLFQPLSEQQLRKYNSLCRAKHSLTYGLRYSSQHRLCHSHLPTHLCKKVCGPNDTSPRGGQVPSTTSKHDIMTAERPLHSAPLKKSCNCLAALSVMLLVAVHGSHAAGHEWLPCLAALLMALLIAVKSQVGRRAPSPQPSCSLARCPAVK